MFMSLVVSWVDQKSLNYLLLDVKKDAPSGRVQAELTNLLSRPLRKQLLTFLNK